MSQILWAYSVFYTGRSKSAVLWNILVSWSIVIVPHWTFTLLDLAQTLENSLQYSVCLYLQCISILIVCLNAHGVSLYFCSCRVWIVVCCGLSRCVEYLGSRRRAVIGWRAGSEFLLLLTLTLSKEGKWRGTVQQWGLLENRALPCLGRYLQGSAAALCSFCSPRWCCRWFLETERPWFCWTTRT